MVESTERNAKLDNLRILLSSKYGKELAQKQKEKLDSVYESHCFWLHLLEIFVSNHSSVTNKEYAFEQRILNSSIILNSILKFNQLDAAMELELYDFGARIYEDITELTVKFNKDVGNLILFLLKSPQP